MPEILLADDFPLPAKIVTESVMIIGRKDSGKTYTGGRLFEQMFAAGAQCVVLDPVGNWYGLRLSASGKRRGLEIPIYGGDHGDIPLVAGSGKLMAQTIVSRNISCVIDLMNFKMDERKLWVTDFAVELFELKKRKRTPLHLTVEEARLFIPQQLKSKLDTKMVDAFEQIVRLGRNYGFGVSLLDQRPQSVNKEVTSQTELLIVHQLTERLGRKEIEDWVRAKTTKGGEALNELDELRSGEAFVWSPGLLRKFAKVKVGERWTFNASATPELGEGVRVEPHPLSNKELQELRAAMASMVQEAEANDPKRLQARVAELERANRGLRETNEQLAAKAGTGKTVEKIVEVPTVDPRMVDELMDLEKKIQKALSPISERITAAVTEVARYTTKVAKRIKEPTTTTIVPAPTSNATLTVTTRTIKSRPVKAPTTDGSLSKAELAIIRSIAWFNSIGIEIPSGNGVAFLAGYTPTGGHYVNTRGALRSKGIVDYASGGRLHLTGVGKGYVDQMQIQTPLTQADLHRAVLDQLTAAEGKILQPLLNAWPDSLSQDELGEQSGYDPTGGHFVNTRGRLRSIGLVSYPSKGRVRAEDFLFPGAT